MISKFKFIIAFSICALCNVLLAQSKPSYFFIYGGLNKGFYCHAQSPITYRAWEFNNFVGVTQPIKPNKSFSGANIGAIADLSAGRLDHMGIPLGIEYSATSNKCSGSRDSSTATITQTFSERTRAVYFGIGISSPAENTKGKPSKLQIGYIPHFSLAKLTVVDKTEINGTEVVKPGTLKGTFFSIKNLLFVRYRVGEKFTLGFFPYYEGHVFDNAAQLTYKDPTNFVLNHELFKLNNFGASLCAVISF